MVSDRLNVQNLRPGTVLLDKFRVVKTLGVGGMGVVVAAEHISLGNRVAIKMMLPNLVTNDSVVKRFLLEARAATRISSEHVARVLDVGSLEGPGFPPEGLPYMVMEHLEGMDLSEWVKKGKKFPIAEAIQHIVDACEALAQAHKVGIIHRDIKPANLFLLERDDRTMVKVLDFGISKLLEEQPMEMGLTKTTTVLGSGLYMSPEQMRSAKSVDFRTDIYSLGVCLYELLTGTQPYTAETFSELCVKVNVDPPTPLREYRPDVSVELAATIARAYARDVDDRYQTVQELALALAPYAAPAAQPTIDLIQGITRHSSLLPPAPEAGGRPQRPAPAKTIPLPAAQPAPAPAPARTVPMPAVDPPMARTAAAVTATAVAEPPAGGSIGMVVTAAIIALAIAAGVALFLMQRHDATAAAGPEASSASETATTSATAATPSETAATSSSETSSSPETSSSATSDSSAEPSASAPASALPPPATGTGPRPPPPATTTARPPPPPKPKKMCPRINPDTGLMEEVPCP